MIRYQESNIKVIFHNISYNFLLIFQVKQSHPVGFSEHINLDYIYLLETVLTKCMYPVAWVGGTVGPRTSPDFSPWDIQTPEAALPSRSGKANGQVLFYRGNSTQASLAFLAAETSLGMESLRSAVGGPDEAGRERGSR